MESLALLSSTRSSLVISLFTTRVARMFSASILVTPARIEPASSYSRSPHSMRTRSAYGARNSLISSRISAASGRSSAIDMPMRCNTVHTGLPVITTMQPPRCSASMARSTKRREVSLSSPRCCTSVNTTVRFCRAWNCSAANSSAPSSDLSSLTR
jgi:hypothetical protein